MELTVLFLIPGCQEAELGKPPDQFCLKSALLTEPHSHIPILMGTVWTQFQYTSPF